MADFPKRYGDVDAPLPDVQEYSLNITFLLYQGHPSLSFIEKTRGDVGKLVPKYLGRESMTHTPKTLREALEALLNYTFELANPVSSDEAEQ